MLYLYMHVHNKHRKSIKVYMISGIEDMCEKKVGVGCGPVYRRFSH